MELTQTRLKELFFYEPHTGAFIRRISRGNRAPAGAVAGSVHPTERYVRIVIDGKTHLAHRLVWLYVYGHWPLGLLDHRDTNRSNNKLENLREATDSQNKCNSATRKTSKSGFKGVSWHTRTRRWVAQICFQGRSRFLGYYDTPEEAHAAYVKAAEEHHGEYARMN